MPQLRNTTLEAQLQVTASSNYMHTGIEVLKS